jgi:hypothetical protein
MRYNTTPNKVIRFCSFLPTPDYLGNKVESSCVDLDINALKMKWATGL